MLVAARISRAERNVSFILHVYPFAKMSNGRLCNLNTVSWLGPNLLFRPQPASRQPDSASLTVAQLESASGYLRTARHMHDQSGK